MTAGKIPSQAFEYNLNNQPDLAANANPKIRMQCMVQQISSAKKIFWKNNPTI